MKNAGLFCFLPNALTAWSVQIWVISGPYFPAFRLNTEIYEGSLRIQSECGKIRTRNNSVFGYFSMKFLLIKLSEPSNHYLIAPAIIVKPNYSLLPLFRHFPLTFKSTYSCSNQFKFYCVKANVMHSHCYTTWEHYTQFIVSCTLF